MSLAAVVLAGVVVAVVLYAASTSVWVQDRVRTRVTAAVQESLGLTPVWRGFRIHPFTAQIEVRNLAIYSRAPTGTPFLEAPRVLATLSLSALLRKRIDVELIRVEEPFISFGNSDGDWINFLHIEKIDELIAQSQRSVVSSPWSVVIRRVRLDRAKIEFFVDTIDLRVSAQELTAEGRFDELSTHHRVPIRLEGMQGLYRMFGRDFAVGAAHAQLDVQVIDGPWVDLVVHDLVVRGSYPNASLRASGRIVDVGRRHLFRMRGSGETELNFLNDVFFDHPQLTGTASFQGEYHGDFTAFTVRGRVTSTAFLWDDILVQHASAEAALDARGLTLPKVSGELLGGHVQGRGTLDFRSLAWTCEANLRSANLEAIAAVASGWPTMGGDISIAWKGKGPDLTRPVVFDAELGVETAGMFVKVGGHSVRIPRGEATMVLSSDGKGLQIAHGRLETVREAATFSGRVDLPSGAVNLDFSGETGDISVFEALSGFPLAGWGIADGHWSGTLDHPHVELSFEANQVRLPWAHINMAQGELHIAPQRVELREVKVQGRQGHAFIETLDVSPLDSKAVLRLSAKATALPIEEALAPLIGELPLQGLFTGQFSLAGPVTSVSGRAEGEVTNAVIYGERFDRLRGAMAITTGNVTLESVVGQKRGGSVVYAEGPVIPLASMDLHLGTQTLWLSDIDHIRGYELAGTAQAQARLRFEDDELSVQASAVVLDADYAGVPLGTVKLGLDLAHEKAYLLASSDVFRAAMTAVTVEDAPARLHIAVQSLDLSRLVAERLGSAVKVRLSAEASLWGPLQKPHRLQGEATIQRLEWQHENVVLRNAGSTRILLENGVVRVPALVVAGGGAQGRFHGRVGFDGSIDLEVKGGLALVFFKAFLPQIEAAEGVLEIDGSVAGTLAQPSIQALLRVQDGDIEIRGTDLRFSDVRASGSFSPGQVLIEHFNARLGGGMVAGNGFLTMEGWVPTQVALYATLDEAQARVPTWLDVTVKGPIELSGPLNSVLLKGDLEIVRALYDERVDWEALVLRLRRSMPRNEAVRESGLHFDLGLHSAGSIVIKNNLAEAKLKGDLHLTGTPDALGLSGNLQFVEGSLIFRENVFTIESGQINFIDPKRVRPFIDLAARTRVQELGTGIFNRYTDILLRASGPPDDLKIDLESSPPLNREDILSLLYIRRRTTEGLGGGGTAGAEAVSLAFKLNEELAGFQSEIQEYFGFEQLTLEPAFTESSRSGTMKLRATKVLSKDVTATLSTSLSSSDLDFRLGYALTENFVLDLGWNNVPPQQAQVESARFGNFSVRPRFHFEFE